MPQNLKMAGSVTFIIFMDVDLENENGFDKVAKRLGLYIYLFMPTGHALGKFEAPYGQISDRKDPGLNKNCCRGRSDI